MTDRIKKAANFLVGNTPKTRKRIRKIKKKIKPLRKKARKRAGKIEKHFVDDLKAAQKFKVKRP